MGEEGRGSRGGRGPAGKNIIARIWQLVRADGRGAVPKRNGRNLAQSPKLAFYIGRCCVVGRRGGGGGGGPRFPLIAGKCYIR